MGEVFDPQDVKWWKSYSIPFAMDAGGGTARWAAKKLSHRRIPEPRMFAVCEICAVTREGFLFWWNTFGGEGFFAGVGLNARCLALSG
jgi:hypothetical protein